MILVQFLQLAIEGRHLKVLVVRRARRPAGKKQRPLRRDRGSAAGGWHAGHGPLLITGLEVIADHSAVPCRHDLLAGRSIPHDRRAIRDRGLPFLFPPGLPRRRVEREDSWVLCLISNEDDGAVRENRRSPAAKVPAHCRRRHFKLPDFLPRWVVAEEPAG